MNPEIYSLSIQTPTVGSANIFQSFRIIQGGNSVIILPSLLNYKTKILCNSVQTAPPGVKADLDPTTSYLNFKSAETRVHK